MQTWTGQFVIAIWRIGTGEPTYSSWNTTHLHINGYIRLISPSLLHTCQVPWFWEDTPDFEPLSETKSQDFFSVSPDLHAISLKSTKLLVFTAVMAKWPQANWLEPICSNDHRRRFRQLSQTKHAIIVDKRTRHVFVKHRCPQRQQSQNITKISKSYILTPSHPRGMRCQWSVRNP